jgi:hypothetical protein
LIVVATSHLSVSSYIRHVIGSSHLTVCWFVKSHVRRVVTGRPGAPERGSWRSMVCIGSGPTGSVLIPSGSLALLFRQFSTDQK